MAKTSLFLLHNSLWDSVLIVCMYCNTEWSSLKCYIKDNVLWIHDWIFDDYYICASMYTSCYSPVWCKLDHILYFIKCNNVIYDIYIYIYIM